MARQVDLFKILIFLNYIIYNPSLHSSNELALILKHEEIHVKQYHTLDVILANLLISFQWFNPLAWVYKNNIEQNLEFLADCSTVDTSICNLTTNWLWYVLLLETLIQKSPQIFINHSSKNESLC